MNSLYERVSRDGQYLPNGKHAKSSVYDDNDADDDVDDDDDDDDDEDDDVVTTFVCCKHLKQHDWARERSPLNLA